MYAPSLVVPSPVGSQPVGLFAMIGNSLSCLPLLQDSSKGLYHSHIAPKLLARTSREPFNNSRQVGIANPGGNTEERGLPFRPPLTTRIDWESRVCRAGRIKIKALRWILRIYTMLIAFPTPLGNFLVLFDS